MALDNNNDILSKYEQTEWEDILEKKNIIGKRPKRPKTVDKINTEWRFGQEKREKQELYNKSLEELKEVEDDIEYDTLEKLRQVRIAKLKLEAAKNKYGKVVPITKQDYSKEVNEASKECHVVLVLWAKGQLASNVMLNAISSLAAKHKHVKFCSIKGTECIPNFPDRNCPLTLIYHRDEMILQEQALSEMFGGEKRCTPEVVEWVLAQFKIVKTSLKANPLLQPAKITIHGENLGNVDATVEDSDDSELDL